MATGFKYPLNYVNGAPESVEGADLVAAAINQLFAQEPGERPHDMDNGIALARYVFENNTNLLRANLRREVVLGFLRNEPRVDLISAPVTSRTIEAGVLVSVDAVWRYRSEFFAQNRVVEVSA